MIHYYPKYQCNFPFIIISPIYLLICPISYSYFFFFKSFLLDILLLSFIYYINSFSYTFQKLFYCFLCHCMRPTSSRLPAQWMCSILKVRDRFPKIALHGFACRAVKELVIRDQFSTRLV